MAYVIWVVCFQEANLTIQCKISTIITPQSYKWWLISLRNPMNFSIAELTFWNDDDYISSFIEL
ncbi:MAG: hypothetical protein CMB36_06335 [Euryarchaeota archaeon]|nr:hypothetical protein [Euryarchaeota archaeon]